LFELAKKLAHAAVARGMFYTAIAKLVMHRRERHTAAD